MRATTSVDAMDVDAAVTDMKGSTSVGKDNTMDVDVSQTDEAVDVGNDDSMDVDIPQTDEAVDVDIPQTDEAVAGDSSIASLSQNRHNVSQVSSANADDDEEEYVEEREQMDVEAERNTTENVVDLNEPIADGGAQEDGKKEDEETEELSLIHI